MNFIGGKPLVLPLRFSIRAALANGLTAYGRLRLPLTPKLVQTLTHGNKAAFNTLVQLAGDVDTYQIGQRVFDGALVVSENDVRHIGAALAERASEHAAASAAAAARAATPAGNPIEEEIDAFLALPIAGRTFMGIEPPACIAGMLMQTLPIDQAPVLVSETRAFVAAEIPIKAPVDHPKYARVCEKRMALFEYARRINEFLARDRAERGA